jgi:glycosyltransferase involved in cell wall biosynthesis
LKKSSKKIIFIATTPFAVNSFLALHLISLSKYYKVTLLVNKQAYPLLEEIEECVDVVNINFQRGVSPWKDLISLLLLCLVFIQIRPYSVHSITPKAGLLAMLASSITLVPNRIHTFTGQVWSNKIGFARSALKFFDRVVAILANHLFSDSFSQNKFLESEGIVNKGILRCLGPGSVSGVSLNRFMPNLAVRSEIRDRAHLLDGTTVFLFVGRLTQDKGIENLLNAFK